MRKLPVGAAFGHMMNSTVNNLGFAWHVSWPWMLIILPLNVALSLYQFLNTPAAAGEPDPVTGMIALVIGLFSMFAFSSIAVSWHRYILRDEVPQGWARLRTDNTVWRYFGNTLLIFLIVLACILVPALFAGLLLFAFGDLGAIFAIPIYFAALLWGVASFYRWSVKLPAIALERQDYFLQNAWADTQNNFWPLVGLAVLFALVILVLAFIIAGLTYLVASSGFVFALLIMIVVQVMVNWVVTIMAVTLLTSLYGFFVERRDF